MLWTSLRTTASAVVWALVALGTPASTMTARSRSRSRSENLASARNGPSVFQSQLSPCPAACTSHAPQDWTVYASFDRLSFCDLPILFDLAIHTPVNDTSKTLKLRACTVGDSLGETSNATTTGDSVYDCTSASESKVTLEFAQQGATSTNDTSDHVLIALAQVQTFLGAATDCTKDIMLGYYNGAVIGVYAGQALGKTTASSVIDQLVSQVGAAAPTSMFAQLCGGQRDADHVLGVAASAVADLAAVQAALVSWSSGECASGFGDTTSLPNVSIWEVPQRQVGNNTTNSNSTSNSASNSTVWRRNAQHRGLGQRAPSSASLLARATDYCTTQTVVSGDSCWSLATEACGITLDEFYEYNSEDMCSTLQVGSKICCTAGSLQPQPYDNGTCYTYTVQSGDTCYDIGLAWSLTTDDLATLNDGTTWGWSGCSNLVVGVNMCLSPGYPPMPAALSNAICGPQVPGTTFDGTVTDASDLATLNPCPLNSCCNIWGQCGIDDSFCTESTGTTGNPGTSEAGVYGCISNCGTDIVNKDVAPSDGYQRVGYYETFNWGRECLHMRAALSNTLNYTHMHWAFGSVGEDMSIYVDDSYSQWAGFMALTDVKKIVSFGGWGFSTDVSTYDILRSAMAPSNRDLFIANLVAFAEETGIDGLDFDWEYPGAPDIPGIPAGLDTDAPYYLATLEALREALPDKYSISIAAPASYWYLKAFPISDIAEIVDYIVYMAYDLHGQWDYGNSYAQAGCPTGNCLRSHVNQTEVLRALVMVTKAGVSSTKIIVGETSYGRSFNMAEAGCTGQDCFFTGTNAISDATPGRCTATGGYISNAEINEIISDAAKLVTTWYDEDTASDYLVYDDLQWVAYMADDTKQTRREKWEGLNFLGTIDWAVDLQEFNVADKVGPTGDYDESSCINVFDNMIWDWVNPVIDAPISCTNLIQASPLATTVTVTAYTTITLVSGGLISTTFVSTAFAVSEINYQPFTIDASDTEHGTVITYNPVPRVTPDPIGIQVPAGWTVTSAGGQADSASTTSQLVGLPAATTSTTDAGGFIVYITWLPTVSYNLPSFVTPKIPAPTEVPTDDNDPTPTLDPGVDDCTGDGCTQGTDCTNDDCTRGGDCAGPNCTRGGDCTGANCVRGGVCTGDNCEEGGDCSGDICVEGGGCSGANCNKGGGCSGSNCNKGGGCVKTIFDNCNSGDCIGLFCIDINCIGMWCDNQIIITVQPAVTTVPTPKPTCLIGCPILAPCADGACNQPCNIAKCPANIIPTAKGCTTFTTASDCTEIISSTAVVTSPTISWSTATRTHCETLIDCDVQDTTVTTTITTSKEPDATAIVTGIYDYEDDTTDPQAVFDAIESDYEEWERTGDIAAPTISTRTTSLPPVYITVTVTPTATPYADCAFWDEGLFWTFEIYNIQDFANDGGASLNHEESGCGAMTGWEWEDATATSFSLVHFNLPFFISDGCVERAIVSAGGPEISCDGQGWDLKKRFLEARAAARAKAAPSHLPVSDERMKVALSVYGNATDGVHHEYIPMDWSAAPSSTTTV